MEFLRNCNRHKFVDTTPFEKAVNTPLLTNSSEAGGTSAHTAKAMLNFQLLTARVSHGLCVSHS